MSEVGRFTRLERNFAKSNLEVPLLKHTFSSIAMKNGTPFMIGNVLCEVTLATSEVAWLTDLRCLRFACSLIARLLFQCFLTSEVRSWAWNELDAANAHMENWSAVLRMERNCKMCKRI